MSYLKIGILLIVALGLVCGTNFYLARCIHHCTGHFFPKLRLRYVILLLSCLTLMMFLSVARPFDGMLQRVLSVIGTVWMGLFVYFLLYFLVADLVALIAHWIPCAPQSLRQYARLAGAGLAVITVLYGWIHAGNIQTASYKVSLSKTPSAQMRVVMLSDLHLGAVGSEDRLKETVACINEQKPDLVCIAGDLFDNDYSAILDPDEVVQTLKKISAKHGVYACLGNHDAGTGIEKMLDLLKRADVQVLEDEYVVIEEKLILAGRLDGSPIGGNNGRKRQSMSRVLSGAPELPVVVMDHNPMNLESYEGEADLILSGHTHKGQIFPGSLLTGAMYTVDYGYYKAEDGTQIVVTSGAGTWGLPVRVGTDCEIASIELAY